MEKTYEELDATEKTNLVSYWALDETIESSGSGASFVYDKMDTSLGSELIVNGTDYANWVDSDSGWSMSTSGVASYDASAHGVSLDILDANCNIENNTLYQVQFTISNVQVSKKANIYILNSSGGAEYISIADYDAGTHTLFFRPTSGATGLSFWAYYTSAGDGSGNGGSFDISNISVKQVQGNAGALI
jgi:hypothetical protein